VKTPSEDVVELGNGPEEPATVDPAAVDETTPLEDVQVAVKVAAARDDGAQLNPRHAGGRQDSVEDLTPFRVGERPLAASLTVTPNIVHPIHRRFTLLVRRSLLHGEDEAAVGAEAADLRGRDRQVRPVAGPPAALRHHGAAVADRVVVPLVWVATAGTVEQPVVSMRELVADDSAENVEPARQKQDDAVRVDDVVVADRRDPRERPLA
jgi:hypothetical protein